jgi:hypothetical protein
MMKHRALVTLLAVCLAPATAVAGETAANAAGTGFSYTPFPDIAQDIVSENKLASRLVEACKVLAAAKPMAAERRQPESGAAPVAGQRLELDRAARDEADAVASASAAAGHLQSACRKLSALPPELLEPAELAWLRAAQKEPRLLEISASWAKDEFERSRLAAAIAKAPGTQQSLSPGTVAPVGALGGSLLRGMTEHLERRAQQEALRYLRRQLQARLCEASPDARAFFSHVCLALDTLEDGASLQGVGAYLRAAADADLRQLPDVALAYAAYRDAKLAAAAFSGRLALVYVEAAKEGRAPLEILWCRRSPASRTRVRALPC